MNAARDESFTLSDQPDGTSSSRLGRTVGLCGAIIGVGPSLYATGMACVFCFQLFTAVPQPSSIRLAVVTVKLLVIGLCICSPLALICTWLAHRSGAKQQASLSLSAAKSLLMPLMPPFILYGIVVVHCLLTGANLGR